MSKKEELDRLIDELNELNKKIDIVMVNLEKENESKLTNNHSVNPITDSTPSNTFEDPFVKKEDATSSNISNKKLESSSKKDNSNTEYPQFKEIKMIEPDLKTESKSNEMIENEIDDSSFFSEKDKKDLNVELFSFDKDIKVDSIDSIIELDKSNIINNNITSTIEEIEEEIVNIEKDEVRKTTTSIFLDKGEPIINNEPIEELEPQKKELTKVELEENKSYLDLKNKLDRIKSTIHNEELDKETITTKDRFLEIKNEIKNNESDRLTIYILLLIIFLLIAFYILFF